MIFVAIPAFGGLACETAGAMFNELALAYHAGITIVPALLPNSSGGIPIARNQLVRDFLESGCERLLFLDADVGFAPGALLKIASAPVDFVAGAYRYKTDDREHYPVEWLEKDELWADPETGLLEVKSVPAGFLSLSRRVFERLKEAFPNRGYTAPLGEFHGYFYSPIGATEDGAFCADWRSIGGQVWLDPTIALDHVGPKNFRGNIGNWLRGPR